MTAASLRRWAKRPYAAVLVWAVLAANLFGLAHEASTAHVRCEHGDLVHVDNAGHASTVRIADTTSLGGSVQKAHEHQHCGMVGSTRQLVAPPAANLAIQTMIHGSLPEPTYLDRVAGSSRLYRTAPKTSPPA